MNCLPRELFEGNTLYEVECQVVVSDSFGCGVGGAACVSWCVALARQWFIPLVHVLCPGLFKGCGVDFHYNQCYLYDISINIIMSGASPLWFI